MLDELVTAYGNRLIVAALGVSLAMLCLFVVLWLLKKRAPSPFVRGGRNRQPRLQVLDAAAVDARRRLVLIRRDNVEHLIMIGGPSDLVIESRIGEQEAYVTTDIVTDHDAEQIAAMRQVNEAPTPAALPRSERQRPVAAPAPVPAARPAERAPVRQAQPPAYQEEPHYETLENEADNTFFYDEFYDEPSEEEELADLLEASRERVFSDREPPAPPRTPQPAHAPAQQPRQQRPAPAPQPQAQTVSASDFERVLEEEIALHLAAEPAGARMPQQRAAVPSTAAAPARPTIAPPRPMAPPLMARPPEPRQQDMRQMQPRAPEDRRPSTPQPAASRPMPPQAARPVASPAARPAPQARPAPAAAPTKQPNLQNEIARIFGEMSIKREK